MLSKIFKFLNNCFNDKEIALMNFIILRMWHEYINMKSNSDNFRESSIQDVIKYLIDDNIKVVIYEPNLKSKCFLGCNVIESFDEFIEVSNMIVANRLDKKIEKFKNKVFSRDLYHNN